MEYQITVNNYLGEEDQILDIIAKTIENNDRIHVSAPVGSGKTTLILELIQRLPDKRFIILSPQISITEQVKTKLTKQNIESCIVNSKTIKSVIKKNAGLTNSTDNDLFPNNDKVNAIKTGAQSALFDRVFLTTTDSAYKLIENIKFEKNEAVVIVDEIHTFLTGARENHTRSVETILKAGFPIVGFSATPSIWVNRMLFDIENFIHVTTTDVKPPVVERIMVDQSALRTLAYSITYENKPLSIVFTENKSDQIKLITLLNEYNPNITVCILNAITKTSTGKKTWDYLMENDELPTEYNLFILNSVVQSGINILNTNVEAVYQYNAFDYYQC